MELYSNDEKVSISAALYDDRGIEIVSLSSSISESKPWGSLVFMQKILWTVFYFVNLRHTMSNY